MAKKAPTNKNGGSDGVLARKPKESDEDYAARVARNDKARAKREERSATPVGKLAAIDIRTRTALLGKTLANVQTWKHEKVDIPQIAKDLETGLKLINAAADALAKLPKSFNPKPVRSAGKGIEEGAKVVLRAKRRAVYAGIAGMLDVLEIVWFKHPMVMVRTKAKAEVCIPRSHVQLEGDVDPDEEKTE